MRLPFEPGAVKQSDAADEDLTDVGGEAVLRADGPEQGVPACEWGGGISLLGHYIGVQCSAVGGEGVWLRRVEERNIPSAILGACRRARSRGMRPFSPRRACTRETTAWSSSGRLVGGLSV